LSAEAVVAAVGGLKASYPQARLVLTGGEPLEQDLHELVASCRGRGWFTGIETNGLHFQDLPIDWWTVSPKDVAAYRVHPRLWGKASEIKLLVTPALGLGVLKKIRERSPAPIVLQPERHDRRRFRRAFAFYKDCAAAGIPDVRLGLQLHSVYRIP
jgi:organic radical activating enzyme